MEGKRTGLPIDFVLWRFKRWTFTLTAISFSSSGLDKTILLKNLQCKETVNKITTPPTNQNTVNSQDDEIYRNVTITET